MTAEKTEKITPTKIVASVLAAVTAAVLSLRLNVVGTVIGAVVASLVTTVGAVLYQRSMEREKRWQVVAIGGLLVSLTVVAVVASVQIVQGTPVKAEQPVPTETQKVIERSTETIKETIKETVQPTTSTQSPAERTTTTEPLSSQPPSSSSAPSSTVSTIR